MQQRNNRESRLPPRSSRHRSSVLGPPPGTNAGTGYISPPQTSPVTYEFIDPPTSPPPPLGRNIPSAAPAAVSFRTENPSSTPPSTNLTTPIRTIPRKPVASSKNARPDSNMKNEPMVEDAPIPPPRSSKRGRKSAPRPSTGDESTLPGVMFYPSTTTISSIDEAELRRLDQMEPMPFFKVDPRMPTTPVSASEDVKSSISNPSRAVSTASSGVLGPVTIDVDPDTDNDDTESIDSSTSEFEQLVRNVSLVRRGTATIIRNPSARKSVIPEISKSASISQKRISTPPDIPLPQPPTFQRRISRQPGSLAPLVLSQFPPVPGPSRAPSSLYSTATATSTVRKITSPDLTSPRYPGPKLSHTLFPVSRQPSPGIGLPPTSPPPSTPTSSTMSSTPSSSSYLSSSNGRGKRRPPPINMNAIVEGETRGSMTSLPDLLDRATKLHEVLATGRTASTINLHGFPDDFRDSMGSDVMAQGGPRGYFVNHFQGARNGGGASSSSAVRWPLFNYPLSARSQNVSPRPPETSTVLDARNVPQGQGSGSRLFPKYDPNDLTPTGPLFTSPGPDGGNESDNGKGNGPSVYRERRCCGLRVRTFIIISTIAAVLIIIAVLTPVFVLRNRNSSAGSAPSGLSVGQCETRFPCQNGGASYLMGNPLQCTCLCAAGFSGTQCQTHDSACVPFSSKDDSANGTSVGSAIQPLIEVAQGNFSSQFTLSADRIIAQFAANDVSCTSQNSLVVLNGSTSADFSSSDLNHFNPNVVILEAFTTVTQTTTIETTYFTTLPVVTATLSDIMTGPVTVQTATTMTSTMASPTFFTTTMTMSPGQNAASLSSEDLVFGRCAILAVVQGFGVSQAADFQETMQLVINRGGGFVNDTTVGVTIDLVARTVTGLPKGG